MIRRRSLQHYEQRFRVHTVLTFVVVSVMCANQLYKAFARVTPQTANPLAVVSSASYAPVVAPDSIASAFGSGLATQTVVAIGDADPNTPGIQLPTQLGGTTLEINGQRAGLFFVSPSQINFVVPTGVTPGTATINVRAADGALSVSSLRVEATVPAIFTADGSGQGVPAAVLLRVKANGAQNYEQLARYDAATNRFVPIKIDLGPTGEHVFLILSLTGIRGAVGATADGNYRETVRLLIDGVTVQPDYAGKDPNFVALDQLNAELPRTLGGRGAVDVRVTYAAVTQSNAVNIEIGGAPPPANTPVSVTGFNVTTALVGDEVTINGANFAANANDNQVTFTNDDGAALKATVKSATPSQLVATLPFDVGTGPVTVRTPQSETRSTARLALRTSVSGLIETVSKDPLPGVVVRLRDTGFSATTNAQGIFILRDPPPSVQTELALDTSSLPLALRFPQPLIGVRVKAGRDNHVRAIPIQQANGASLSFTAPAANNSLAAARATNATVAAPQTQSIQFNGVTFAIADNTTALFPSGGNSGAIFLNTIPGNRTPVSLPPGVFSSTIAQVAPFNVRLVPGGKLTFPNADGLAVNAQPRLYKLDQTSGSPTVGEFIAVSTATVSADGQRVETADTAITETSVYFVAVPRPLTNVIGRVVDSDGKTPVRGARVVTRGQETTTDGLGQYILLNVPLSGANDQLTLDASLTRPGGRVDRAQRTGVAAVQNGLTRVPDLTLVIDPNRPPTLIVPPTVTITEGLTRDFGLIASDPDAGQTLQVTVTGAGVVFATIIPGAAPVYNLRLAPGAGTANTYTLIVKATDSQGASVMQNVALTVFPNRPPVLRPPAAQIAVVGCPLSFSLLADDPDEGQTLSFSAVNPPSGVTLSATSATSARFTWTPAANQVGNFAISLTARDNGLQPLSDTKTVNITVAGTPSEAQTAVGPGLLPPCALDASSLKAGSVLVYNFYTSNASNREAENTRIMLTNTSGGPVGVRFYFVDGNSGLSAGAAVDYYYSLTPYQTTTFLASDLDPGGTGYLIAVAVDRDGCPVSYNFLTGGASVKLASGQMANYSAVAFSALYSGTLPGCSPLNVTARVAFDGVNYNRAPRAVALDNLRSAADGNATLLVLNRLEGDTLGGVPSLGALSGTLFDDSGTGLPFNAMASACQLRMTLSNAFPATTPNFNTAIPAGRSGWLRIFATNDVAVSGLALNFNANAPTTRTAFTGGGNLDTVTLTESGGFTIRIRPF